MSGKLIVFRLERLDRRLEHSSARNNFIEIGYNTLSRLTRPPGGETAKTEYRERQRMDWEH